MSHTQTPALTRSLEELVSSFSGVNQNEWGPFEDGIQMETPLGVQMLSDVDDIDSNSAGTPQSQWANVGSPNVQFMVPTNNSVEPKRETGEPPQNYIYL